MNSFTNNSGASENFPGWDAAEKTYPGYPFLGKIDGRDRDPLRKFVGEDTFYRWDKPLISHPLAKKHVEPPSELSSRAPVPISDRTQPQVSRSFPPDPTSIAEGE